MKTNSTIRILTACTLAFLLASSADVSAQRKKHGQAAADSLIALLPAAKQDSFKVKLLNDITFAFCYHNPQGGIVYGKQAIELARDINFKVGEAGANFYLAELYYGAGNYPKTLEHYLEALRIDEEIGFDAGMSAVCLALGNFYAEQEDNEKAMRYYERTLQYSKKVKNDSHMANALSNMGMITEDKGKAIEYFKSALPIQRRLQDHLNVATTCMNLGSTLRSPPDPKPAEALAYYYEAVREFEAGNNELWKTTAFVNIGIVYVAIAKTEDRSVFPDSLRNATPLLNRAELYLLNSIEVATQANAPEELSWGHLVLSMVLEAKGNYQSAFSHYQKHIALRDTIHTQETKTRIASLTQQREDDLKQKQIELQQLRIAKAEQERWFSIAGVLMLLALGGVLFNRYRLQQRNRRALDLERVRSRISRDLHDEIGSALSSVSIYSTVAMKNSEGKQPELMPLLQNLQDTAVNGMENMHDIVWAVNPKHDRFANVIERLQTFAEQLLGAKGIALHLNVDSAVQESRLTMEQRKNIYLICKEAVTNVAKYSGAENCYVNIGSSGIAVHISIRDDGNGIADTQTTLGGNGLINMKKRADELKGILDIVSEENKGTSVILKLQL